MSDAEARLPVARLQPERLLAALVDGGVAFVVIGGFSLAAHGIVRATKDIDIIPDPERANLRRLTEVLRGIDAEPLLAADFDAAEIGVALDADGLALGGNWVLRTRFGRLDVMQDVAGVRGYAALRARAVTAELPDVGPLAFAGLEDLVAMKAAADRPQDRLDIADLERVRRSGR
jgi:Nucleotidyl transferase AbiEii toxin, Type IV TA system